MTAHSTLSFIPWYWNVNLVNTTVLYNLLFVLQINTNLWWHGPSQFPVAGPHISKLIHEKWVHTYAGHTISPIINNALIRLSLGLVGLAIVNLRSCHLFSIICSFNRPKSLNTLNRFLGMGSSWRVPQPYQPGDLWKCIIPFLPSPCQKMQWGEDVCPGLRLPAAEMSWAVHHRPGPQVMQRLIYLMNCPEWQEEKERLLPQLCRRQTSSAAQLVGCFSSPQSLSEMHPQIAAPCYELLSTAQSQLHSSM